VKVPQHVSAIRDVKVLMTVVGGKVREALQEALIGGGGWIPPP
jgi:hypothetical protein